MSTIYCSKFAKRFTAMMLKRIMEWDLSKLHSLAFYKDENLTLKEISRWLRMQSIGQI